MTRISVALALLPVVAVLGGCGSSSTAPNGNGNPTVSNYVGTVASPAATGSFKATITTPASAEVLAGSARRSGSGPSGSLVGPLGGGGSSMTITVTLLNGSTLTLSGSSTGTSFTVTDNASPPDMCTGTVANVLSATCSFLGNSNIPLVGILALAGAEGALATYCGFETLSSTNTTPIASLFLGVAGTNSFLARVASSNDALSFYLDDAATSTTIADTLLGSTTDYFNGAYTSSTASGSETNSGTTVGSWSATSPCTLIAATASPTAVAFTAAVSAAPEAQAVTVTPAAGGPITAVVAYPAAPAPQGSPTGWLTATVSGSAVMLSVSAQTAATAAGAPLTATVNVYPQFANNAPLAIAVTYTVTSGPQPVTITSTSPLSACVDLINCTNQLTATGGTGTIAWSLATGSTLPSWLTLSPGGLLSGTAPAGVAYPANAPLTFSVTATDGTTSATKQFQIVVFANVTITSPATLPNGYFGATYCCLDGYQLTASGGPTSNYGWAVAVGSALPSWLSLSTSGVLSAPSGPPVGATTPVSFYLSVASGGSMAVQQFTINIYPVVHFSGAMLAFTMTPDGAIPAAQAINLTGFGGPVSGLRDTIGYGAGPSGWLTASISPTTTPATLTVQPSATAQTLAAGNYTALISVSSSVPGSLPGIVTVTLAVGSTSSCVISPSTMPPFYIGAMVDFAMIGSAGCGANQVWSLVTAGSLPTGLTFGPGGVLFGTPTTAGDYTFALRVQNTATGNTSTETYTNVPVDLSTSCIVWPGASNFLPSGTVGALYPANSVSATPPCTTAGLDDPSLWVWSLGAGAPPGLSLNPGGSATTTSLVGTPTGAGGTYTFTITFTNMNQTAGHNEATASQSYTVTIAP